MSQAHPDRFKAMLMGRRVAIELMEPGLIEGRDSLWWRNISIILTKNQRIKESDPIQNFAKDLPLCWFQKVENDNRNLPYIMLELYFMAVVRSESDIENVQNMIDKYLDPILITTDNLWLIFLQVQDIYKTYCQNVVEFNFVTQISQLILLGKAKNVNEVAIYGAFIGALIGEEGLKKDSLFTEKLCYMQERENVNYSALVNGFQNINPIIRFLPITYPMRCSLSESEIENKRKLIMSCNGNPMLTYFDVIFVERLISYYDELFFGNCLRKTIFEKGLTLKIVLIDKTSNNAGCLISNQFTRTINIYRSLILGTFSRGETCHWSNGIKWSSRLECLMSTLEHELIHLIIDLWDITVDGMSKIYSQHGKLFMQIVKSYFGHTDFLHALDIDGSIIQLPSDFSVGESIFFFKEGKEINGKIRKLNKRTAKIEINEDSLSHFVSSEAGKSRFENVGYGFLRPSQICASSSC